MREDMGEIFGKITMMLVMVLGECRVVAIGVPKHVALCVQHGMQLCETSYTTKLVCLYVRKHTTHLHAHREVGQTTIQKRAKTWYEALADATAQLLKGVCEHVRNCMCEVCDDCCLLQTRCAV